MDKEYKKLLDHIQELLSLEIHRVCETYAVKNLKDEDFILLTDAYGRKVRNIYLLRDTKTFLKKPHTLKLSSVEKYDILYYQKLTEIIDRVTGKIS